MTPKFQGHHIFWQTITGGVVAVLVILANTSLSRATDNTEFANVAKPGSIVAPGDLVRTTVFFGAWNLVCDTRRSSKRRVCSIDQVLADTKVTLRWQIALATDGQPMLAIDISSNVDQKEGLVLRVGKFITTIPLENCGTTSCRAVIPFDGFVQKGIIKGEVVGFGYTLDGRGAAIAADMAGLSNVLQAAQHPPEVIFKDPQEVKKAAGRKEKKK